MGHYYFTLVGKLIISSPRNDMPMIDMFSCINFRGMDRDFLEELKKVYGPMIQLKDEVYEKILPYLHKRVYQSGQILKHPGETELNARLIIEGVICYYELNEHKKPEAKRVYFTGQNAFDLNAYVDQKPSESMLVAKTKVITVELSNENEKKLLSEVPEASTIAVRINQEISKNLIRWENILKLPKKEAYETIISLFPDLGVIVKVKDLQDILGIGKTTLNRIRKAK